MAPTIEHLVDHHARLADTLDATKCSITFRQLIDGKVARGNKPVLRLGIDASSWLLVHDGESVSQYRNRACLALAGLIDTAIRLDRQGHILSLVIVFDNPDCPHPRTRLLLHSNFVREATPEHAYQDCVREVIEKGLFRPFCQELHTIVVHCIVYRDSTLLATKELAQLNATGKVHAVLGQDYAALLFGAKVFIRMPRDNAVIPSFEHALDMYAAPRIKSVAGLSRGGLVLTVLLSAMGSNEPVLNLPFDVALAAGRMNRCSLGDELLRTGDILQDAGPAVLAQTLANWTTRLQFEMGLDLHGVFGGPDLQRAYAIPHHFPDRPTVISYTVSVDPQAEDVTVFFSPV